MSGAARIYQVAIVLASVTIALVQGQTQTTKEYIRLGGRVIAIETSQGAGSAGSFTLDVSNPTQNIAQSQTATFPVTITPKNGFTGRVSLVLSRQFSNLDCSANDTLISGTQPVPVNVTCVTSLATLPTNYIFSVSGLSGSTEANLGSSLTVNVVSGGAFNIGPGTGSTGTQQVVLGTQSNVVFPMALTSVNGFNSAVNTSVSSDPGLNCSVPASVTPPSNGSATFSVSCTTPTSAGSYSAKVTAASGGLTQVASLAMIVALPSLTVDQSTINLPKNGGSGTINITSNVPWSIAGTVPSWMTLGPLSGGAGSTAVAYTVAMNSGTATLSANFNLSGASITIPIAFYEDVTSHVLTSVSPTGVYLNPAGGSRQFTAYLDNLPAAAGQVTWTLIDGSSHFRNDLVTNGLVTISDTNCPPSPLYLTATATGGASSATVAIVCSPYPVGTVFQLSSANGSSGREGSFTIVWPNAPYSNSLTVEFEMATLNGDGSRPDYSGCRQQTYGGYGGWMYYQLDDSNLSGNSNHVALPALGSSSPGANLRVSDSTECTLHLTDSGGTNLSWDLFNYNGGVTLFKWNFDLEFKSPLWGQPLTIWAWEVYPTALAPQVIGQWNVPPSQPPLLTVESPLSGIFGQGQAITLKGWAIDNQYFADTSVQSVRVTEGATTILANVPLNAPRTDICTSYPGRAGCPNVGFNTPLPQLSVGTHNLTITATDADTPNHSSSVQRTITINAAPPTPTFNLLAPASTTQTVTQGTDATFSANLEWQNGFAQSITVSTSSTPSGLVCTPISTSYPLPSGGQTTSAISVDCPTTGITPQAYTVTLSATAGTTKTVQLTVTVQAAPAPGFQISLAGPTTQTIAQGAAATFFVKTQSSNGFASTVTLTPTPTPTGLSCVATSATPTANGSATVPVVCNTTTGTAAQSYTVAVQGTASPASPQSLAQNPAIVVQSGPAPGGDFTVTALQTADAVAAGGTGVFQIQIQSVNGFVGTVTFDTPLVSPTGVTCSIAPITVAANATAVGNVSCPTTLSTSVNGYQAYQVTLTGRSGTLTPKTAVLTFSVRDFTTPAPVSVSPTGSVGVNTETVFTWVANSPYSNGVAQIDQSDLMFQDPSLGAENQQNACFLTLYGLGSGAVVLYNNDPSTGAVQGNIYPGMSWAISPQNGQCKVNGPAASRVDDVAGQTVRAAFPITFLSSWTNKTVHLYMRTKDANYHSGGWKDMGVVKIGGGGLPPDFTVTALQTADAVAAGGTGVFQIQIQSVNGFVGTVTFDTPLVSPTGVTCSIAPITVAANATAVGNVSCPTTLS